MNETNEIHIRIRGLTDDQYHKLRNLARQKLGTNSLARYTKKILLNQLNDYKGIQTATHHTRRFEVRLDMELREMLSALAQKENMTVNGYTAMLLQGYINKEPVASTAQVQALYQSNVQLVRLGNNLNQIAKALNSNQQTNLTTELLHELKTTISKHTEKVGNIITANIERLK